MQVINLLIIFICLPIHCSFSEHFNRGTMYLQKNQLDDALHEYNQAYTINQQQPELLFNMALLFKKQKKITEAITFLQKAIAHKSDYAKAHFHLAQCYNEDKQPDEALKHYQQVITYAPDWLDAYTNIAQLYAQKEEYHTAVTYLHTAYKTITCQTPTDLLFSLASHLVGFGQADLAITLYDMILTKHPHNLNALYNKAYTLKMADQLDQAITLYQEILSKNPHYEQAHLGLAMSYLVAGNFPAAWHKGNANLQHRQALNAERLGYCVKTNTLAGKTVLLASQGGFGDTIHYIRCAQQLKEKGARIVVVIQKALIPLLARCPYIDQLIPAGAPVPPHDFYSGLMSLPAILEFTEEMMSQHIPYLFPDPALIERWRDQLAYDTHFKIGICWHVSSFNDSSRTWAAHRSIPLTQLYPLASLDKCTLYSLQKKDGIEELNHLPSTITIISFDDLDKTQGAFMDTAALIKNLDLVISADTSIAHLAGALGVPVWLLLPYQSDARWIAGRTDSPWYPTMRIFKQKKPFEWEPVIEQVRNELNNKVILLHPHPH